MPRNQAFDGLRERLGAAAGAGGGWAYYAGRASRVEPTAWALIALASLNRPLPAAWSRPHVAFLASRAGGSGLLVDPGSPAPNYAWNGLALVALRAVGSDEALALHARLLPAVVAGRGVPLSQDERIRQDSSLRAWPWIDETFSWIEPTALCLLALKQHPGRSAAEAARITEAEALIVDRTCPGGGWNYGNAQVLGQDLRPYVPTTALALIAMQDRAAQPAVRESLAWLEAHATSEPSTLAWSLAALALALHGRSADAVVSRLAEQEGRTGFLGNAHLLALALLALTLDRHAGRALRVSGAPRAAAAERG